MADTDPILRPAIEAAIAAENADPDDPSMEISRNTVVTGYVVIAMLKGFDDEGEDVSQTFIMPDGSLTECLGMIEEAKIRYHAAVMERYA